MSEPPLTWSPFTQIRPHTNLPGLTLTSQDVRFGTTESSMPPTLSTNSSVSRPHGATRLHAPTRPFAFLAIPHPQPAPNALPYAAVRPLCPTKLDFPAVPLAPSP